MLHRIKVRHVRVVAIRFHEPFPVPLFSIELLVFSISFVADGVVDEQNPNPKSSNSKSFYYKTTCLSRFFITRRIPVELFFPKNGLNKISNKTLTLCGHVWQAGYDVCDFRFQFSPFPLHSSMNEFPTDHNCDVNPMKTTKCIEYFDSPISYR